MNGRHELKYHINASDYAQLRMRLQTVARLDENVGDDDGYIIRSLYFDNYSDKAVVEKLSGLSRREKFRLRYYNDDTSLIRLEKKSKENRLTYKESTVIKAAQCAALLAGEYDCLKTPDEPLFMELYTKIRYQNLRPKSIVEYHREAYTYHAGNVRVTFDSNIRTANWVAGFLNRHMTTIPAAKTIILEIKYDGFLPDIISDILQIGWRNQTEFSKYVVGRLV
ncbi:polyphosphate polymerase domain-containing protein [Anoxynatronum buryatiense]|uniref:VTC domain-containing protein n=1 Tax=Anoxynatronum buryatiense TaxID=489973 RepID=A0AA46AHC4_9CLOT|nr:polyphosphate polymerase domain-containing protein [Anoxynatronum buryatiense]SMP38218.1 VTC domain-containing protein [Anoxynatronum buryatiense]